MAAPLKQAVVDVGEGPKPVSACIWMATGIKFRGMSHHVCEMSYDETCVDQSELVNVGAQIN